MECHTISCTNEARWQYKRSKRCDECRFSDIPYTPIAGGDIKPPTIKICTVIGCVRLAQWALGKHPNSVHCTQCKDDNENYGSNYNYTPLVVIAELSDPKRSQKGDLTDALIDFALLKEVKV